TAPVAAGGVGQPGSPLAAPTFPVVSPLATPTLDPFSVAATGTAAAAATATSIALFTSPTPLPTATLLPPTVTATSVITITATTIPSAMRPLSETVRPLALPPPTQAPAVLPLFSRVLDATVAAAGWIWFLCGSLIFFATAGILAGLGFRRQERRRYALVDAPLDVDEDLFQVNLAPPADADDSWPASLP
ncbi:MAG: hypothetical protein M3Q45_02680, partial [Chloroflexota bacterium]|nr:hypothetical protein [Chloroflexota bacterium]